MSIRLVYEYKTQNDYIIYNNYYEHRVINMFNRIKSMVIGIPRRLNEENISEYAAHASFFTFISAFPFILLILTVIKYTPLTEQMLLDSIENLAPGIIEDTIVSWINELYTGNFGFMSLSIIITLWSASRGIRGIVNNLNKIYDCRDRKKATFVTRRLLSLLYTLILVFIVVLASFLIIISDRLGERILQLFPVVRSFSVLISFRMIIAAVMFFFIFLIMYTFIPYRKSGFRHEIYGAILTTLGCYLFTYGYSIYMRYTNPGNSIYGSLAAVIFFLMWMYACMYIMFCGALLNKSLHDKRGN